MWLSLGGKKGGLKGEKKIENKTKKLTEAVPVLLVITTKAAYLNILVESQEISTPYLKNSVTCYL